MKLPVKNIVSEIDLRPNDTFLPLFECVVNSIISLMQINNGSKKKIQIQIERGDHPTNPELFDNQKTIESIKIIDNGEGFTSVNLESFDTAYSHKNKEFGCKGVGRFTILAAFEKIEIESHYFENNEWKMIRFDFDPEKEIHNKEIGKSDRKEKKTIVHLRNLYNHSIKNSSARTTEFIAEELMNHCLIYYLSGDLPRIEIFDIDSSELSVVNEKYENLKKERERSFNIGEYEFKCYITKTEKANNRKNHYSYFCANSRVVGSGRNLAKSNSLFMYPISDNNGRNYFLDVYLVSDFLNKKVYSSRNGFAIPYERDLGIFSSESITYEEIENSLAQILTNEYNSYVKETQEKSNIILKEYILKEAPQYRRYANKPEILSSIPPNLSDEKKEEYLFKISYHDRKRIEKNIQEFINKKEINEETIQVIKKELAEKTSSDIDSLADYMFRRRAIIDIFKKFLEADTNGSYKLEEDIHNLIFPMGVTQNEIDYDSHNLWILDERFATYSFIASDKPITRVSQKKSRSEPDLLMLDEKPEMFENPISFASSPSGELQSMVIFEFKRPGETAHQKSKNDYRWEFSELIEKYFDDFLYGQDKKNYKGRHVIVHTNTPKYGYVIVDVIPPRLEEYNKGRGYRKTPFGTLFKIYPDLNMHIEVITFEQLIRAVETRHAPFFDKLFMG
ncbi:hypothetical protein OKW21_005046 [Catalinimonas alkaloidigena]|uniref:hypothetical protein n=1 Tax=Catalinimonas alkaloidigena TaxID=1075417 RepID=UPI00240653FC|nr:hypothetical protein [Catalinimonas alkaloidigena]MDF9799783.1 hypothetical protein [Catalinimonas alkaloidigena]